MVYNLVEGGAAIFSLIGCLAIFLQILIFKRYKEDTQRLLLYLIISVSMNSINSIVRGAGYEMVGDTVFCIAVAYVSSYTSGCILVAICCIGAEMLIKIIFEKRSGKPVQILYFILIFILPIFIYLIPFYGGLYGQSGPTCWITSLNFDNCTRNQMGEIEQGVLWNIPLFFLIVAGSILYVITLIIFHQRMKKYKNYYTDQRERLVAQKALEETKQYRWYPLIFFMINIVPFITRFTPFMGDPPMWLVMTLWIITALIDGLQGMVIAAVFTLDPETRSRLTWKSIRGACILNWGPYEACNGYIGILSREQEANTPCTEHSLSSEVASKAHLIESSKH